MTEQPKFPAPHVDPEPEAVLEADAPGEGTLIERVVRNYDLVRLDPAPIPDALIPPAAKRRRYRRAAEVAEVAEVPACESVAGSADPGPRPEVVVPDVMPVPSDKTNPPPVRKAQPVLFKGPRHPVDRQHLGNQALIVPEGAVTGLLEEFRIVKRQLLMNAAQLQQQGMGAAAQRVLICSPHPGEGKTFTAVNLALAIAAEKETEVLLVDADFAKPSVLSALGLSGSPGLMDALVDPAIDVADCVVGTDISGLWVLPAGSATTSDTEYLSSSRTRQVLDRLVEGAPNRFVIFDSPPALAASPAAELAKYVGQAVVVARADRTGHGALEDAIKLLSACPNLQLLLNAVNFSPSGRRFGSYYGYGG